MGWVGDEDFAFGGSGVPEDFSDVPGAIGVVDEKAVAERLEFVKSADQSFGGGALHERAGLSVDGSAEEIVYRCVADVEMNGGVEGCQFDEFGLAKRAIFVGRGSGESIGAKFGDGTDGLDENLCASVEVGRDLARYDVARNQLSPAGAVGTQSMNRRIGSSYRDFVANLVAHPSRAAVPC